MLAQLIPLQGGPTITLTQDVTLVGRKPGLCDLVIDKSSISKMQCLLVKTDGLLYIRDLCSTNGTKVNGQRVIRGALLPGDEIYFASVGFQVHLGPDQPPPPTGDREPTEMMSSYPVQVADPDDWGDFAELDQLAEQDAEPMDDSDSDVQMLD